MRPQNAHSKSALCEHHDHHLTSLRLTLIVSLLSHSISTTSRSLLASHDCQLVTRHKAGDNLHTNKMAYIFIYKEGAMEHTFMVKLDRGATTKEPIY